MPHIVRPLKCRYIVGAKYSHSVSCRPYIQGWDLCLYRLVMRGTCDIELLDKTGGSAVLYTVELCEEHAILSCWTRLAEVQFCIPLKCCYIVGAKYSHSVSCRPYIQGWDMCLYRLVMRGTCDIELLDKTGGSAVLYTVELCEEHAILSCWTRLAEVQFCIPLKCRYIVGAKYSHSVSCRPYIQGWDMCLYRLVMRGTCDIELLDKTGGSAVLYTVELCEEHAILSCWTRLAEVQFCIPLKCCYIVGAKYSHSVSCRPYIQGWDMCLYRLVMRGTCDIELLDKTGGSAVLYTVELCEEHAILSCWTRLAEVQFCIPLKCRYIVGAKYSHSVSCRPYIQGWDMCLYRLVMRGTCDIELLDKTGGSAVLYAGRQRHLVAGRARSRPAIAVD
ncbi:hypothetical protein J6590_020235 [Homalodisca vitripennis]|nr:hypothetical protein J6590_020235 [Homalodisca vitripennis]